MSGYSIIKYKGKEISYIDYRGLSIEEMIKTLDVAVETSLRENKPKPLLINITDAYAVKEFMDKSKEAAKKTRHNTTKSAIVGITGAKKVLLNTYNLFTRHSTKPFDDEESAKEWLIKE